MINQPLLRQLRLWTVLIVVVPVLLIMSLYTYGQMTTAKSEKLELISQRVEFQKVIIEDWIEERAKEVRIISQLEPFQIVDLRQMEKVLHLEHEANKNFDSLSYIDKHGVFKLSTLNRSIQFPSTIGQPYYEAAAAGKEYISDIVVGRNSGLAIINFSSPVYDPEGKFQGLILGSVRTAMLETILRDNWIGNTGEIVLIDREGMLIAQPRDPQVMLDKGFAKGNLRMKINPNAEIFAVANLGKDGGGSGISHTGDRVLGASRYLPERNWTLIGSISESEILLPIYEQLLLMAAATLLIILIILPLITRLTGLITDPIDWLIQQSDLVAGEKYELVGNSQYTQGAPRELNNLCAAFVAMSRRIHISVNLIKDHEASLEEKVREIEVVNSALKSEIAERQKAQAALEEANAVLELNIGRRTSQLLQREEHYRRLIENIPDCIGRYDREYHRTYANQAAILDNAMPEALVSSYDADGKESSAEQYMPWLSKIEAVFATGMPEKIESWGGPNNCFYSIRFIPEGNLQGEVTNVLCIATDITDKRRSEADITRLGLLNIVGEMAVGIGHEVRNPLTTVRGYLQLFQMKPVFANYHSQISDMITELDKANGIITDFLSLAKNRAVKMERGNINQLIESLCPLLQADAGHRGHEVQLDLGEVPETDFDKKEIRQMIINLVHNALEAMSSGGIVTMRTAVAQGSLALSISDTGNGIAPEVLEKLGTPFVTTKDAKTGLGLAICFQVAHRHHAKIDVVTGSEGTTFTINFPISN